MQLKALNQKPYIKALLKDKTLCKNFGLFKALNHSHDQIIFQMTIQNVFHLLVAL